MNMHYLCTNETFIHYPGPDVRKIDVAKQIELFPPFFGVNMPEEDKAMFIEICSCGKQEDYGVIMDEKLIGRACIWNIAADNHEIAAVKVLPEYRRRGYGLQLVSFCTAIVLSRGYQAIGITDSSNTAMRRVFEKAGFYIE